MAENLIKENARLLGVEIGQNFEIIGVDYNPYHFTKNGLINHFGYEKPIVLYRLITGKLEVKKSILTYDEKKYLQIVLNPFKDRIKCIRKVADYKEKFEWIEISCKTVSSSSVEVVSLPSFTQGEMYKCLNVDTDYSLEELELFR